MVRGPISMVIVGIITLFMFGLVGFGPRMLEKIMPEFVLVWIDDNNGFGGLLSLTGTMNMMDSGSSSKADPDNSDSHLRDSSDGWRPSDMIAAMPRNRTIFIKQVLDGRRNMNDGQSPAAVDVLTPLEGCSFTPPSAAAFVSHVSARGSSGTVSALATYDDADLADAVQIFARVIRKSGRKQVSGLSEHRFDSYDIVVTEVEKPVYLVLQSTSLNRLWTIHLAPGARLERVVLVGGDQAGVANVPADVPVEVMRAAELQACQAPVPFYPLNPGALFYQSVEIGAISATEAEEKLAAFAEQGRRYDGWFRQQFGVGADETMAGNWDNGAIAVAGPAPATPEGRAVYAPLKAATARITIQTYVEYAALAKEGADFSSRVVAIATAFAWGDLNNLKQGVKF